MQVAPAPCPEALAVPILMGPGVTTLSVPPGRVAAIRAAHARATLSAASSREVRDRARLCRRERCMRSPTAFFRPLGGVLMLPIAVLLLRLERDDISTLRG